MEHNSDFEHTKDTPYLAYKIYTESHFTIILYTLGVLVYNLIPMGVGARLGLSSLVLSQAVPWNSCHQGADWD